jgi:T-complex protein 1 subunit gamma
MLIVMFLFFFRYFTFLTKCDNPKACSIILRGPSKDIIAEIERNLQDAMCVARNVFFNAKLAPGGGATEMAVSVKLEERAKLIQGVEQWPYRSVAEAMEVIPRTLVQNCGGNSIKILTQLRAKHSNGEHSFGIEGESGKVVDMKDYGVWEPSAVKVQTIKTAIEVSIYPSYSVGLSHLISFFYSLHAYCFVWTISYLVSPRTRAKLKVANPVLK